MNCSVYDSVHPGLLLQSFGLVLPAEGMIVNLSFLRGLPGTLWRSLCRFCLSSVRDRRARLVLAQIPQKPIIVWNKFFRGTIPLPRKLAIKLFKERKEWLLRRLILFVFIK